MSTTNNHPDGRLEQLIVKALSTLTLACAAACAVDAQPPAPGGSSGESMASTSQALSGVVFDTWGGVLNDEADGFTNGSPVNLDLKVGSGWTCWVAGVFGNLEQTGAVQVLQNEGSFPIQSIPAGNWVLTIGGLPGQAVLGSAACAPSTDLGTDSFFPTSQGAFDSGTLLSDSSAGSWCGLGVVYSESLPPYVWSSSSSFAEVTNPGKTGGTWTFSEDGANADATCAHASGATVVANLPIASGATVHTTLPAGSVCFLTKVEGPFVDSSFTDGVGISVNFSTNEWTGTASEGKSGTMMCIH